MPPIKAVIIFPLFFFHSFLNSQETILKEKRTIHTTKIDQGKIILDGILNEEEWRLVSPATNFIQRDPIEGAPSTERTEVFVIYVCNDQYIFCRAKVA